MPMFESVKNRRPSSLKRKAEALTAPSSDKKSKKSEKVLDSSQSSSEPVSDDVSFQAYVVPSDYRANSEEVLKGFDEIAHGQSLVSQAEEFYKNGSKVCVKNGPNWDSLSRYRTAVYMGQEFGVGDDVLVLQEETVDNDHHMSPDLQNRWVGRILEIRASDQENVHILINWYSRPEDLPKGRRPHHGMNEVLATNDVDIISPTTLVNTTEVVHWVESDDTAPPDRTKFWRQCAAMEDRKGPRFSKLNGVCICKQPGNVDKLQLYCEDCNLWMHDECLIKALAKQEKVADKSWKRLVIPDEGGLLPDVLPNKFQFKPAKGKPWTVEIQDKEFLFVSNDKGADAWEEKIMCLKCSKWLG